MKTLILEKSENHVSEIFQSLDVKFTYVNKLNDNEYKQCFVPIKCRDFLGDCIWSRKTGNKVGIYGFNYSFSDTPYDLDKLRLSLTFPNTKSLTYFKKNFKQLLLKEESAGVEPSVFYDTDIKNTIIIEASAEWQSNIWKISLYTFFLKLISYKTIDDIQKPESIYINFLTEDIINRFLSQITGEGEEPLTNCIRTTHNNSGFVSILEGHNDIMKQILLGNK